MARTRIFQPTLSLLIGLAMAVYGLIHAATHLPAGDDLRTLWASMPAAGAFGLFLLGVIAVVCGVALLVAGGQTLRRRVRQVDRVLNVPGPGRDYDPDENGDLDRAAYYGHRAYR
mgnify:FL=1